MKQVIPLNSLRGGQISPTIPAHYYNAGWSDFSPMSQIPHIAIMEIISCNEATSTPPLREPCIIGYTRGRDGKIQNYHMKNNANTIHSSTGSGGNTSQYVLEPIIKSENTDKSTPPHE